MDYFSFYKIPISFLLDESDLRQKYLQFSKDHHPDFFTLADEEAQARVLELSTLNNEAYKTLSDFEQRMSYILKLKGFLDEKTSKNDIPSDFLMEMMDVNEVLMELEFDFNDMAFQKLKDDLTEKKGGLFEQILPTLQSFEADNENQANMEAIQVYYLKMRYFKRLEENLNKLELERG